MMKKILPFVLVILLSYPVAAQWAVDGGLGAAFPVTGYGEMVGPGGSLQIGINKRISESRMGLGARLAWARMHRDDNDSDFFIDVKLDQVPVYLYFDYELLTDKWKPYVGLGLGFSMYNISYNTGPATGGSETNISFSFLPMAGLRMQLNENLFPFFELNAPVVTDGPPAGASESDKATGYVGMILGLGYRF